MVIEVFAEKKYVTDHRVIGWITFMDLCRGEYLGLGSPVKVPAWIERDPEFIPRGESESLLG